MACVDDELSVMKSPDLSFSPCATLCYDTPMKSYTPNRRRFLQTSSTAAASLFLNQMRGRAWGETTASSESRNPPNIIFLLADDLRWDGLGCMGNSVVQTPRIDGLSANGVTFTNCFCTTPICAVSRASFFTGLYARSHGIHGFGKPLPPEIEPHSYPALLRTAGYRTGFIGKWGLGGELPKDQFDFFSGFLGQGWYFNHGDGKNKHLTTLMGDDAVRFIDESGSSQPFCLSVSFKAPHVQDQDSKQFLYNPIYQDLFRDVNVPFPKTGTDEYFQMLPPWLQTSEGRVRWEKRFATPHLFQESAKSYFRLIAGVDAAVGRIIDRLKERGLQDNTVIIFTSDNGFYLGEHGLAGKWFMHEESVRLPLIVYDPRMPAERKGQREAGMALNIDISPTILSAAGIEIPPWLQGRDLFPLVRGERIPWRKEWFFEHLFEHPRIPRSEGVYGNPWKYTRYIDQDPDYEMLFNIENDALEEHDLARDAKCQDRLQSMRARTELWIETLHKWRPEPDFTWVDPS